MTRKYDWQRLKDEFVEGRWLTVSSFLQEKGVLNNSYSRKRAAGWLQVRDQHQQEIRNRTREKALEDEAGVRARQASIARAMQVKGVKSLANLEVHNADHARKLLVDGMREEREVLGLSEKQDATSLTQVNVSLPKTRYDEMIDKLNYEELLQFITEIKRERQRRTELESDTGNKVTM